MGHAVIAVRALQIGVVRELRGRDRERGVAVDGLRVAGAVYRGRRARPMCLQMVSIKPSTSTSKG